MKTTEDTQSAKPDPQPSIAASPLPEGVDQIVSCALVDPSPTNRKHFPEESLAEMEASLRTHGFLQRPCIRPKTDGRYELIFGERRWLAASRIAADYPLPVTVRPLSDRQALELQKIENLQREDLDPIEEAIGLRQMIQEFGYTLEQLETQLGKKRSAIYGKLKLANLCDEGAKLLRSGLISESVALRIARIPEPKMQKACCKQMSESYHTRNGETYPDRDAKQLIERDYMKELKGAPFNQKDEKLLPVAIVEGIRVSGGACTDCPMRAGNQPDFDPKKGRADVCLNPTCYQAKCEASFKLKAIEYKEAGGKVLEKPVDLQKVFSRGGYVQHNSPLKSGGDHVYNAELPGKKKTTPTLEQLAKHLQIEPTLALHPGDGSTVKLYPEKQVLDAAREAKLLRRGSSSASERESQKVAIEKGKQDAFVESTLMTEALAAIGEKPSLELLRFIASRLAGKARADQSRWIIKRRGIDPSAYKTAGFYGVPHRAALEALGKSELSMPEALSLIVEIVCAHDYGGAELEPLFKFTGLDLKARDKAARATYAEQKATKANPKGKGTSAPKPKGKPADRIIAELQKANGEGVSIKALVEATGIPTRNVQVWLALKGKRNPQIQKTAPGVFKWIEKKGAAK